MAKPTAPTTSERTRGERTRGNGDGTIYPFEGRFRVAVPYRDPATGKTKYKVKLAPTRRVADHLRVEMIRDREAGLDLSKVTVETFLAGWLNGQRLRVKASTVRTQEGHIRLYINPALGRMPVAKVTPSDVERLMSGLVDRGLSPRTARHVRTTFRKALGTAARDGLVLRNVAASVELPRVEHREMTALTTAETGASSRPARRPTAPTPTS